LLFTKNSADLKFLQIREEIVELLDTVKVEDAAG